ncbi:hypothetical protein RUM44_012061 [Polyplax serrata]|uniref:Major facilitator superfamily (MFS) profile domain-containing protein n=1 Tax=Polyplax serrata TaxID=468196 RepID=A0ABR1BA81_POLSC
MTVMTEENRQHGNALPQHILTFIVNVVAFAYGATTGWLSNMQPLLQANYTNTNETSPLGADAAPLTSDQISWLGGIYCLGGIIATPSYGYLAKKIGRKYSSLLTGLPFIVTYILILLATNPMMLYVARFAAGLGGGGVSVIAPMYVGETAEVNNRGLLGSYFNLFICLGILSSYIIGAYTTYNILGWYCLSLPTIFVVLWFWLPEAPIYSLLKDRVEEARKSLVKLRGNHHNLIESELTELVASLKESQGDKRMSAKEMLSEPETRKGFIIGGVLMLVQQMSGISPILNYTVAIFQASGSDISPSLAAIIVGALQILGAIAGTMTMERFGRKVLLMVSSIGMAFSLLLMTFFFYLKEINYDPAFMRSIGWIPVTALASYVVEYGLGFGPVPFVIVGEIFKTEAKSAATSFSTFVLWFVAFLLLTYYSDLSEAFGTATCFGLFGLCCILGAVFIYFYVPETKGKSLEQILTELGGKRQTKEEAPLPLVDMDGKNQ